jgi:hypothetical protein
MSGVITPKDLKKLSDEIEAKKAAETIARMRKAEDEQRHLREAFMEQDVHPDVAARVSGLVRRAAEQGLHEIQLFTFPATWTNDHGRRINNNEPDWPDSLEGFAKRAHAYFEKELRPLGYKARAQVLNYPDGVPGDIGIFLSW